MSDHVGYLEQAKRAEEEYIAIEQEMVKPEVISSPKQIAKLSKKYRSLQKTVDLYRKYISLNEDLEVARELAKEDSAYKQEIENTEREISNLTEKLREELLPKDPDNSKNTIMEIKAGSGGEESALFAGDLLRMYTMYAEHHGWKVAILTKSETGLGGYKDVHIAIRSKSVPDDDRGVWYYMKYEGGVHRVQRVPATESQGRIHTSAVGVYVYPEIDDDDDEIEINPNEIRIDVYRSSGPGGQSVNTTDSAVRITHLPTGIVVSMQDEKSQIQNREHAMRVLASRLLERKREEEAAERSDMRKSQVRTADRSERIRTYNFSENRIVDHRSGFKAYNLDQVLDGKLDDVINSCIEMDNRSRIS